VFNGQNRLEGLHQTVGIHYYEIVNMHIYQVQIVGTLKNCRRSRRPPIKPLPVATKPSKMNLVTENFGGLFKLSVLLALGCTVPRFGGLEHSPYVG